MLNIDLTGKVAIVTGGSRGVGAACSKILAQAGAIVAVNYSNKSLPAEEIVEDIVSKGRKAIAIKADVSDKEQVVNMIESVVKRFGKIDILVNNAGITSVYNIENLSLQELERIFKVNVFGAFNCCQAAMSYLVKNGEGSIINIGSTSMYTGGGGGPHYAASKSALMGLTRNLAIQYGPKGIRTNTLAISLVNTDLLKYRATHEERQKKIATVPIGRLSEPEDVAYMVSFLASNMASYINGEIITIDGGRTYS